MKKIYYNKLYLFTVLIAVSFSCYDLNAQSRSRYSQYMFNQFVINPAYVSVRQSLDASLIYRAQWINVKNSPVSQTFFTQGGIPDRAMGVGVYLYNQTIGVQQDLGGYLAYAYQIKLKQERYIGRGTQKGVFDNLKLSIGLQVGINQLSQNLQDLQFRYTSSTDPVFQGNNSTDIQFDIGTGLFLYSETFYVSLSALNILENNQGFNTKDAARIRHFFLTSGIIFPLKPWLSVKPKVLVRYVVNSPIQIDTNINFYFLKRYWLGFSYRFDESVVTHIELQLNSYIRVGYAFDYGINEFTSSAGPGHEASIGYTLNYSSRELVNPRYF